LKTVEQLHTKRADIPGVFMLFHSLNDITKIASDLPNDIIRKLEVIQRFPTGEMLSVS
jgi:hypothetical protein